MTRAQILRQVLLSACGAAVGFLAGELFKHGHLTAAVLLLSNGLALSFAMAGWHFGKAHLLRQLHNAGALRRPPPACLQAASDDEVFVEFMARSFQMALRQGDPAAVAKIREAAERMPALRARLAAFSADEPRVTTYERGQA